MKCQKCGTEFESKFCPNCGEPAIQNVPTQQNQQENYQQPILQPHQQAVQQNSKVAGKNSGLSITALVLSIIGCTFFIGAILAIIDLCKKDGRKKTCSIIALVIASIWLGIGFNYNSENKSEVKNVNNTSSNMSSEQSEQKEDSIIDEKANEVEITYTIISVDELVDMLDSNALKASETYKDMYVEITGKLSNIDASGKYISLDPLNKEFNLTSVLCYVKSDEVKEKIMNINKGDTVTLRGKITDVGEVLGYSIDIDSIE